MTNNKYTLLIEEVQRKRNTVILDYANKKMDFTAFKKALAALDHELELAYCEFLGDEKIFLTEADIIEDLKNIPLEVSDSQKN